MVGIRLLRGGWTDEAVLDEDISSSPSTEGGSPSLYTDERTSSTAFHTFYGNIETDRLRPGQAVATAATAAAAEATT